MYILAGEKQINNVTVIGETQLHGDVQRPALRVQFEEPVTDEQLTALLKNDWHLMDDTGGGEPKKLSVQTGYTEALSYEVVFVKVDARERENIRLKEEVAAATEAVQELLAGKTGDEIARFAQYIPKWHQGEFKAGDVRTNEDGYPYTCIQAHDSTNNPTWNLTVPALWAPYHAKSAACALPFVKPTHAGDIYRQGEWMEWTDGQDYECLGNTEHGPDVLPQNWREGTGV